MNIARHVREKRDAFSKSRKFRWTMLKSITKDHVYFNSLTWRPGGRDCFNFSAFSLSVITSVYKNREHRTLNFTFSAFFFILTLLASFLLALSRKSLISVISRGILNPQRGQFAEKSGQLKYSRLIYTTKILNII